MPVLPQLSPPVSNILERWDITVEELSQAILENGSLRGIVFGYVAEIKLRKLLQASPLISGLTKDDDHNRKRKGDLRITYGGREFRIESKSLQTAKNKRLPDGTFSGVTQVDGSDEREVLLPDGSKIFTTNLLVGEFDILAAIALPLTRNGISPLRRTVRFPAQNFVTTRLNSVSICWRRLYQ